MSSSASLTLRKKPNQQGLCPLAIRITKNRKSTFVYIGHYVDARQWDDRRKVVRKSHHNAAHLNNLLASKLADTRKVLLALQADKKDITAKQIKKEITFSESGKSFFEVADQHILELKAGRKYSRISVEKAYLSHLKHFVGSKELAFQDIDETFLKSYVSYLMNKRGVSRRSAMNQLVLIRTLFNRAIMKEMVDRKFYPFGMGKMKITFPESQEIKSIENLVGLSEQQNHARNVWLFSFYLAGVRISDLLKLRWDAIYDGRLHYRMGKNSKLVSLQLPDKIIPILEHYALLKEESDVFIFPELKKVNGNDSKVVYDTIKVCNRRLNRSLKEVAEKAEIQKKLTMHIARHSFGHIAGDKIPVQMLQQLYRHSSVVTTMMYQSNFISKEKDKALNKIINF